MEVEFKYDIAFSFLERDLSIAKEISKKLNKDIEYFLYTDEQKELVAKDGIDVFNSIFQIESRIVFLLHRNEWGNTNWTKVEENAMKNRYLEEGEDFVFVVSLDENPQMPKWIPKAKIWYDYKRFGVDGLVSILEHRVKQRGKILTVETAEYKYERIRNESENKRKIYELLNGYDGKAMAIANAEFAKICEILSEKVQKLNLKSGTEEFAIKRESNFVSVRFGKYILIFGWSVESRNSLSGSNLQILIKERIPRRELFETKFAMKNEDNFAFDINLNGTNGWTDRSINKFFSSENIINKYIQILLDYFERDVKSTTTYSEN